MLCTAGNQSNGTAYFAVCFVSITPLYRFAALQRDIEERAEASEISEPY
jgi:hypothetical protein